MKRPQKKAKKGGRPTSKGAMQAQRRAQQQQKSGATERSEAPIFDPDFANRQQLERVLKKDGPKRCLDYENNPLYDFKNNPFPIMATKDENGELQPSTFFPPVLVDCGTALCIGLLRNILKHHSDPANITDLKESTDFSNITLDDLTEQWLDQYSKFAACIVYSAETAFIMHARMPDLTLEELRGGAYCGMLRALQADFDLQYEASWFLMDMGQPSLGNLAATCIAIVENSISTLQDDVQAAIKLLTRTIKKASNSNQNLLSEMLAPDFDASRYLG